MAVEVFAALGTQWRVGGMGSVIGLDYAAIPPVLRMLRVKPAAWPELFGDLRVMERAALAQMNG